MHQGAGCLFYHSSVQITTHCAHKINSEN